MDDLDVTLIETILEDVQALWTQYKALLHAVEQMDTNLADLRMEMGLEADAHVLTDAELAKELGVVTQADPRPEV